jgi:hypothetical protein
MAGDERLRARAGIVDGRPVAQEPLRFLAQRPRHVAEPRPDDEAVIERFERRDPATHGIDRRPHLAGQRRVVQRTARTAREDPDEHRQLIDFLDAGPVTQVAAHQPVGF